MSLKRHFPGQLEDETIFTVIHRHWFNIFTHFIAIISFTLLTLFIFFFAPTVGSWLGVGLSIPALIFLATTILLFLWLYAFFIWIDYYFDVWVITNERVLNIEQKGLFTRVMSEVHLGRVQDVTTQVEGFLPTLLHYGDIFVQTAGEEKHFHFRNVANPDIHKDNIVRLVKKIHERKYSSPATLEESV